MNECLQLPESPAGVTGTVCPRSALRLLTPQRSSGPGGPKRTEKSAKTLREISAKKPKYLLKLSFLLCYFIMLYFSKNLLASVSSIFQIDFPNRTGKPLDNIREFSAKLPRKKREIGAKNLL
jgi:hypothetical protein